jgi:hypothetical protein
VPEDQGNPVERYAVAQHLGRCRVPQDVGAFGRRNDTGSLHGAFHHRGQAVAVGNDRKGAMFRTKRWSLSQTPRAALDIVDDRISDVLRERQAYLIASLPRDPQRVGFPLDIGDTKPCYVAGP